MRKYAFFCVVFVILALQMGPLTDAQADVVGRLTQVEGRVDILRGGQLPATPVKVDDGVQPGDVLRTKSLSKAQITFIDDSTMTIAPESRVAIEAYMVDSAQNKRNAVIELFKGLAHVVVNKVYQSAEPDFVVKTQTAIMRIRGTEFGIRLQPNSSDILNFKGLLQVGNIFPEVGQLPQRAFKVAYSFGSGGGGGHWVFLKEMQGTSVAAGLPPTMPWTISDEDRRHFMNQLGTGLNICRRNPESEDTETGGGPPSETISGCAPTTGLSGSDLPNGNLDLISAFFGSYFTPPYTPPNIPPEEQTTQLTTESLGTPENQEKPPCDHKRHHHFRWHHHFHFDRDFFCRRDHDDKFDFHFDRDFFCRRDRDDRSDFHFDRDFFCRKDHDGKFGHFRSPWEHRLAFHRFGESERDDHSFHNGRDFSNHRDRDHHGKVGHFRGPGHGPNPPNFILSNVITNPAMHCFRNFPGKPGILPGGITDHREGHQAVHHRKHKHEGNPGHSPGGQVNGPFQGGPPGNHQGPMTGGHGSKNGGGGA